jgi:putative aldouronate transport system substrate-binding protein
MDPDFALYETGNDIFTNKFKAGYVGAYIGNWDLPYRDGDLGVTGSMHAQVGPEANFIAVDSFPNNAGVDKKYLSAPVDRKVFFPATNDEPVASLLYVDWISRPDVRFYLQLGTEGINYEVTENGAYQNIPTDTEHFINSAQNIDYTITINGLDVGDPAITALSMALGYAGVEPRLIETSYVLQKTNFRIGKQVSVGVLASEDGLGTVLTDKGYELFAKSIVAAPEEFDAVYDQLMGDLMTQYGDASQAERAEKFQQYYGDVEMLP